MRRIPQLKSARWRPGHVGRPSHFAFVFPASLAALTLLIRQLFSTMGLANPHPGLQQPVTRDQQQPDPDALAIQNSLLSLPGPLQLNILALVAEEGPEHQTNALLACKALQQAGEAVPRRAPLILSSAKLQRARAAGRDAQLLAWVSSKAQLWQQAVVEVVCQADLRLFLGSLAAAGGGRLRKLKLRFGDEDGREAGIGAEFAGTEVSFHLPQELEQLTSLTALSIWEASERVPGSRPASDLAVLSTLTALQSLAFEGFRRGPLPPEALSNLQQLTSLELTVYRLDQRDSEGNDNWDGQERLLGSQHLSACTALRRLALEGVEPSLSESLALEAWQHLQELEVSYPDSTGQAADAGFWHVLPQLSGVTRLAANGVVGDAFRAVSSSLPACSRLASLQMWFYPEPTLPPLPPTLTQLEVGAPSFDALPVLPSLRSLSLVSNERLPEWPGTTIAMAQLTKLSLSNCLLYELPAPLAALPSLESLNLTCTELSDLPHELACVGSLRWLGLFGNYLSSVPAVLGSGAASRLEHLDLGDNFNMVVDDGGLAVLASLTALTHLNLSGVAQGVERVAAGSDVLRKAAANSLQ